MNTKNSSGEEQNVELEQTAIPSRRRFFQLAGGIAGAGLLLTACHPTTPPTDLYLGTGDTALLNFLYVLQQMEADFYTKAVTALYLTSNQLEYLALTDLRDQEIAHREYIKTLLGADAISAVVTNFSNVNFTDRTSVLTNAAILEDIVLAGFNGASGLFTNLSFAQSFAKLISVEARHSAYVRDVLVHNSFTDGTVVTGDGLAQTLSPATVLTMAQQFLTTRFDSSNLPH